MKKKKKWKETHWDTWTFWKKIRHVLAVIISIIAVIGMWLVAAYVVLIIFGVWGFILKARDMILLDIMHTIFG
jgi:hypothetical protein